MKKQAQKMTEAEAKKAERKAYLMNLVPAETLKKFTKKRADKVAEILVDAGASHFTKIVGNATKKGIAYADRFIAIAELMAASGLKETKDLWGRSEYDAGRAYIFVLLDLAELSLKDWAKGGRIIIRNQEMGPVAKAYKYNRKAKELWISFNADGMVESIRRDECTVYPDKNCAAFEWVAISEENKKHALELLVAGSGVQLPKF